MAELVAEAFLAALFEKLFERFASPEFHTNSTGYQLKQLESKLKKARLLLDDAEDRQLGDPSVKEWLDDLKHVVFQADDLAEEIGSKKNKKFGRTSFKSIYHSLVKTVRGEVGVILTELDGILDRAIVLGLKHGSSDAREGRPSPRITTPLREEHNVFGRNDDKEEILKLLLSDEAFGGHQIGVVPIVGMGGLGKTTLAQLVYNDNRVKEPEFKLRAWVTVSTEFDVFRIVKMILKQINPEAVRSEVEEPTELQRQMKDVLRGKKFLFVFDDLWDENYNNWDLLVSNFSSGVSGSRIVVTTRSTVVASVVKTGPINELGKVSNNHCWSIFIHHALFSEGESNADPRLHEIGRRIVEKCNGLPLAVKAIGGLLRSERNLEKWEGILNSHVWEWSRNNQDNGVLPSLWLSYRYLPSPVKQCFAYCSVFPQDYEFRKEEMVLLWMAEGFMSHDEKEKRAMEEVGEEYFDILVSRSLFQRSSGNEAKFVMHDLVHDLATFVSGEFCLCLAIDNTKLKRVNIRNRYLSHDVSFDSELWTSVSRAKHLRSFLSLSELGGFPSEFVKKLITKQTRLRVLSLFTRYPIPFSFGNLKHLRYLNLSTSNIHEVPSSVCTLLSLQTLLLSGCYKLIRLPMELTKLVKLRHLDITDTGVTDMPPGMGNLKELRTLTNFVLGNPDVVACSSFKEIQQLHHLSGKLIIYRIQNAVKFEDAGKDILQDKANLKELVLEWNGISTTETRRESKDILDALRPHTNLEKLDIRNYPASSFPVWVGDMSFWKLASVQLNGDFCDSLPPLGHLPSLRELMIEGFHGVEKIGLDFYGNTSSVTPFRCLETLKLTYMKSLKEWVFVGKAFPCLKHLSLLSCWDLPVSSIDSKAIQEFSIYKNSLECFPLDKFPMLRNLSLATCFNLKSITNNANSESLCRLDIRDCPNIESLPEAGFPKTLSHLRIDNCSQLTMLQSQWDLHKLPSLTSLAIGYCECDSASSALFPLALLPESLTSLELFKLGGFKGLNESAFQQAKSLKKLYIYTCDEIESLPEKELLSCLSTLGISNCPLLEKKYRINKGESCQHVSHIPELYIGGDTTEEMDREE